MPTAMVMRSPAAPSILPPCPAPAGDTTADEPAARVPSVVPASATPHVVTAHVEPLAPVGEDERAHADEDAKVYEIPARRESAPPIAQDRRRSGQRRRARDRLMDRATRPYPQSPALTRVRGIENLMLFVDDDLRETALSLSRIESFLVRLLDTLERPAVTRGDVHELASDLEVLDQLDMLNETLESLRRRMAKLATKMRLATPQRRLRARARARTVPGSRRPYTSRAWPDPPTRRAA